MHWHYWRISVFWSRGWHVMGNLRCHIQPPNGNLHSLTKTASNALQGPIPSPIPGSLSNVITSKWYWNALHWPYLLIWGVCSLQSHFSDLGGQREPAKWLSNAAEPQSEITPLLGQMLHPSLTAPSQHNKTSPRHLKQQHRPRVFSVLKKGFREKSPRASFGKTDRKYINPTEWEDMEKAELHIHDPSGYTGSRAGTCPQKIHSVFNVPGVCIPFLSCWPSHLKQCATHCPVQSSQGLRRESPRTCFRFTLKLWWVAFSRALTVKLSGSSLSLIWDSFSRDSSLVRMKDSTWCWVAPLLWKIPGNPVQVDAHVHPIAHWGSHSSHFLPVCKKRLLA